MEALPFEPSTVFGGSSQNGNASIKALNSTHLNLPAGNLTRGTAEQKSKFHA
jgi:hypothetical protein